MIRLFTFLLFLVFSGSAAAGSGPQKLDDFLQNFKTLSARFEQSVLDTRSAEVGRFQGQLFVSRPGRFRWDYSEPYEKEILADGDQVYVIDSELEQITYVSQERALKDTPASVLIDADQLDERFEIIDIGSSQNMDWVELLPRDAESQFTRVLLAFAGDDLRRMEMADKFGQITRFQFYDVQRNPQLDSQLFVFERRQGYDLIDQF
ncbi:MAG: outer membrane lipoprotein chaperone LolA [Chromatiales bacterium]|jgi:outer membrane lipoprotein carrier protein